MILAREILWCKDDVGFQGRGSCEVNEREVNFNELEMEHSFHQQSCCWFLLPGLLKSKLSGNCMLSSSFSAELPAAPYVFLNFSRGNYQHE